MSGALFLCLSIILFVGGIYGVIIESYVETIIFFLLSFLCYYLFRICLKMETKQINELIKKEEQK